MENTSLAAKGALANRLQRRTTCKIQNGCQGAPKFQGGSGKVSTPRFLGVLSNFRKISFLIRAPLWDKVATEGKKKTGEKKTGKKEKKIRMKIVTTTSLPAVDCPNADCWNAASSRQKEEKTDDYSGHYIIASSWPPERRPLERRTLVLKKMAAQLMALSFKCLLHIWPLILNLQVMSVYQISGEAFFRGFKIWKNLVFNAL